MTVNSWRWSPRETGHAAGGEPGRPADADEVTSRGQAVPSRALLGAGKVHEYPAGALEEAIVSDPTL